MWEFWRLLNTQRCEIFLKKIFMLRFSSFKFLLTHKHHFIFNILFLPFCYGFKFFYFFFTTTIFFLLVLHFMSSKLLNSYTLLVNELWNWKKIFDFLKKRNYMNTFFWLWRNFFFVHKKRIKYFFNHIIW